MNTKTRHTLANYHHLMEPHEKLAARWLIEEWDQEGAKLPSWLKWRIAEYYPHKLLSSSEELSKFIVLRILRDHKSEIHLDNS